MKCPVCTTVNLAMTDRQGVEIDYCPQCRGIWLDRGELDKIIERSGSQAQAPRQEEHGARQPFQAHHDNDYYKNKKHKNLLSELFDF